MIDEIDGSILAILQYNARTSQAELSKAVGLAPSAVLERLRKLESKGIIRDYVALIDPHVVDRGLLAFVAVRTSEHGPDMPSAIELGRIPEVLEVHHVAGDDCYLLKVRTRDAEHLGQLLRQQIASTPSVISTRTTIVLETVKEDPRIAIPREKMLRDDKPKGLSPPPNDAATRETVEP
ncbi:MAG: Lrp/AsnC family transcriptional regulator [Acidobacteriota bacterium]|nr:Lrp/AsnC family transcriptional regulator [Acidobacteriota bacterium]